MTGSSFPSNAKPSTSPHVPKISVSAPENTVRAARPPERSVPSMSKRTQRVRGDRAALTGPRRRLRRAARESTKAGNTRLQYGQSCHAGFEKDRVGEADGGREAVEEHRDLRESVPVLGPAPHEEERRAAGEGGVVQEDLVEVVLPEDVRDGIVAEDGLERRPDEERHRGDGRGA